MKKRTEEEVRNYAMSIVGTTSFCAIAKRIVEYFGKELRNGKKLNKRGKIK